VEGVGIMRSNGYREMNQNQKNMFKYLFIAIQICWFRFAAAQQFLVISGSGGSADIREWNLAKTGKSLKNGTVVFWEGEGYDGPGYLYGWLYIRYSKDAFYENADETLENLETGLVHQSQVTELEKLSKPAAKEFSMKYTTRKFNFSNKKLVWGERKAYIESVNGKKLFGADCGLPKTEIVKAEATIGGKKISIEKSLLLNILGAADGRFQYFKKRNTYFALQSNGDGACFYYVVWVFDKNGLKQRILGWSY